MKKLLALAVLSLAAMAASASSTEQRFLLNTDVVPAQAAPTIVSVKDGNGERIVATFQRPDGVWVKHTLTPTSETRYGAFGEPVVRMTDVIPNP
jgi:hypothetical protein